MNKDLYNDLFPEKEKTANYRDIIFEYLLYWPVILICLIVALGCAYIYLRYQTPVYNVSSTVLIKQGDKTKPSYNQMASMEDLGTLSMANNFDNEVEILQAFTLIKKVVSTLNLYISYEEENDFGYNYPLYESTPIKVWMAPEDAERLPSPLKILFDSTSDGKIAVTANYTLQEEEHTLNKLLDKLPAVFITPVGTVSLAWTADSLTKDAFHYLSHIHATINSPSAVAGNYKARLTATPTTAYTSIVRLVLNDTNIPRAKDFLTTLVNIYNDEANEDKNQVAMNTAEFIDERIRVINEELGTTEDEIASYKQREGITNLDADAQLALQGNSVYDQRQADNANQLRLIKYLREYIENPANKNEVIPVNVGLTDAPLTNIINQYNEMLIERKRLLRTSKETSPAVINLEASISATRNTVLTTVESVEKSLEITRKNLDLEAGKYRTRISNTPQQERELRDISRQQEIKANLYLMLLQKREENALTLAAKANNGRVVEEARAAGLVSPNTKNIYMIAFILGLIFPVGGIWLVRSMRFKIETREDVQRITNAPIVGDIPRVKQMKSNGIVVRENRNDLMEEIYRELRTNLQYMLQEGQQVILFTSTSPNEGKSFNACNLAASFAFMEQKTVIVGLDVRNPSLGKIFGIEDTEHGITDFLSAPSSTDILKLCRPSSISSHLYILPCGIIPPNPTELVARPSLDKAIQLLKETFDYVIIDAAPIGVTDTRLIARVADLCVYVCRADFTRKNEFEAINKLWIYNKLPNFCVLINGINMDTRKNGYYYGYGRYAEYGKYGYGKKH